MAANKYRDTKYKMLAGANNDHEQWWGDKGVQHKNSEKVVPKVTGKENPGIFRDRFVRAN